MSDIILRYSRHISFDNYPRIGPYKEKKGIRNQQPNFDFGSSLFWLGMVVSAIIFYVVCHN